MIAVIGEALIDLVADASGSLSARPGGGPYNTARTIGRLGLAVTFAGRLADDSFGRLLHAGLAESGVTAGISRLSAAPTTLAVAGMAPTGARSTGSTWTAPRPPTWSTGNCSARSGRA